MALPTRDETAAPGGRHLWTAALLAAGALLLGACLGPPDRQSARARVTAETESDVNVVTSTNFSEGSTGQGGTETRLITSDTFDVVTPWERTFDIRQTKRFFVRVLPGEPPPSDSATLPVNLLVAIDGDPLFDLTANVFTDTLEFSFLSAEF